MNTVPNNAPRLRTPEYTLPEVVSRIHELTAPLAIDERARLRAQFQGAGAIKLTPLDRTGSILGDQHPTAPFRTRVSVYHQPPDQAGLPNPWISEYTTPDTKLCIAYLRSGTPVSATFPTAAGSDAQLQVDPVQSERNVRLLQGALDTHLMEFVLDGIQPSASRSQAVSIDLQSPYPGAIEEPITRAQAAASAGILQYINIPVGTERYRSHNGWKVPAESLSFIQRLTHEVRNRFSFEHIYQKGIERLLEHIEQLRTEHEQGIATPGTRYALAARTGLLVILSGRKLHVNCRSGKDRTGLFDSELKFAAYQLWREAEGLPTSPPGQQVLDAEQAAWQDLLLKSGNAEIQLLNAGVRGNRVFRTDLQERIGAANWAAFIADAATAQD